MGNGTGIVYREILNEVYTMKKSKTLTKVLIIITANLLMLVFGISAFFTILYVRDYMSEKAVGTCLKDMEVQYESLEIFSLRDDVLCVVLDEDGKYSLYSVEGDHKDIKLVLLWYDMNIGDKYITPSCTEEYSFASRLYDNKEAVPETAYKTVELKTENTTVYFCVEHFIFGNIVD